MKATLINEELSNMFDVLDKAVISVGIIVEVERIPKNKKMIKMVVHFNGNITKTVISNIGQYLEDVSILKYKSFPFITNVEPREANNFISEAIIIADIHNNVFNLNTSYSSI